MKEESKKNTFCRKIKIGDQKENKMNQGKKVYWTKVMMKINYKELEIGD
jgi:hypothetical protein